MRYSADIETTTLLNQDPTKRTVQPYIIGIVPKPNSSMRKRALDSNLGFNKYLSKTLEKQFSYFAGYDCGSQFVEWIENNFSNIQNISFHNLKFDWSYLEKSFIANGWVHDGSECIGERHDKKISILQDDSEIYKVTLHYGDRRVVLMCSLKLLKKSVKDIGSKLGQMSKGEINYNQYGVYKDRDDYLKQLIIFDDFHNGGEFLLFNNTRQLLRSPLSTNLLDYLKRDCIIPILGEEAMKKGYTTITKKKLKKTPLTISSYSQSAVESSIIAYSKGKNAIGSSKVKMIYNNPLTYNQFREIKTGYRGGFTGYQRGSLNKIIKTTNGASYDANSFFPSIMTKCALPGGKPKLKLLKKDDPSEYMTLYIIKIKRFKMKPKIKAAGNPAMIQRSSTLIAFVEKDRSNDNPHYLIEAINPNRSESDGVMSYWADHLKQLETYYDIEYDILKTYYFKKQWKYKKFIERVYPLKRDAKDEATRNAAKLLLNTIYGKTGQEPVRQVIKYIEEGALLNYYRSGEDNKELIKTMFGARVCRAIENRLNGEEMSLTYHKKSKRILRLKTTAKFEESLFQNRDSYITDYQINNIAIAHRVTSIARHLLMGIIAKDPKNVLYWDTDSIYMINNRPKQLGFCVHDTKLNCWKKEKDFDTMKILRGKAYATSHKGEFNLTISGYNPKKVLNGTHITSFNDFKFGREWEQTRGLKTEDGIVISSSTLELKENKFNFKSFD